MDKDKFWDDQYVEDIDNNVEAQFIIELLVSTLSKFWITDKKDIRKQIYNNLELMEHIKRNAIFYSSQSPELAVGKCLEAIKSSGKVIW